MNSGAAFATTFQARRVWDRASRRRARAEGERELVFFFAILYFLNFIFAIRPGPKGPMQKNGPDRDSNPDHLYKMYAPYPLG